MNVLALVGNVCSSVILTPSDRPDGPCTGEFRIAVSRPAGETEADFFDVVVGGRQAEICEMYLDIGRRIGIEGCLAQRFHLVNGDPTSRVVVNARRVELLSPRKATPTA